MFAAPDDYGTSYYYRGVADNNYVKFGDFYWRIVRITGDGSIKLIYQGEIPNPQVDEEGIGKGSFNMKEDNRYNYVGYTYDESGILTSSDIKIQIENWYENNIENKSLSKYISDMGFCQHKSEYDLYGNKFYSAWYRNSGISGNVLPILTCPTKQITIM